MKYNKLVRDKIPEIIKSKSQTPVVYIANEKEYGRRLRDKLIEEVKEFLKEENKEEFADIIEVIHAIGEFKRFDKREIKSIRMRKLQERGGFEKRIVLKEVRK